MDYIIRDTEACPRTARWMPDTSKYLDQSRDPRNHEVVEVSKMVEGASVPRQRGHTAGHVRTGAPPGATPEPWPASSIDNADVQVARDTAGLWSLRRNKTSSMPAKLHNVHDEFGIPDEDPLLEHGVWADGPDEPNEAVLHASPAKGRYSKHAKVKDAEVHAITAGPALPNVSSKATADFLYLEALATQDYEQQREDARRRFRSDAEFRSPISQRPVPEPENEPERQTAPGSPGMARRLSLESHVVHANARVKQQLAMVDNDRFRIKTPRPITPPLEFDDKNEANTVDNIIAAISSLNDGFDPSMLELENRALSPMRSERGMQSPTNEGEDEDALGGRAGYFRSNRADVEMLVSQFKSGLDALAEVEAADDAAWEAYKSGKSREVDLTPHIADEEVDKKEEEDESTKQRWNLLSWMVKKKEFSPSHKKKTQAVLDLETDDDRRRRAEEAEWSKKRLKAVASMRERYENNSYHAHMNRSRAAAKLNKQQLDAAAATAKNAGQRKEELDDEDAFYRKFRMRGTPSEQSSVTGGGMLDVPRRRSRRASISETIQTEIERLAQMQRETNPFGDSSDAPEEDSDAAPSEPSAPTPSSTRRSTPVILPQPKVAVRTLPVGGTNLLRIIMKKDANNRDRHPLDLTIESVAPEDLHIIVDLTQSDGVRANLQWGLEVERRMKFLVKCPAHTTVTCATLVKRGEANFDYKLTAWVLRNDEIAYWRSKALRQRRNVSQDPSRANSPNTESASTYGGISRTSSMHSNRSALTSKESKLSALHAALMAEKRNQQSYDDDDGALDEPLGFLTTQKIKSHRNLRRSRGRSPSRNSRASSIASSTGSRDSNDDIMSPTTPRRIVLTPPPTDPTNTPRRVEVTIVADSPDVDLGDDSSPLDGRSGRRRGSRRGSTRGGSRRVSLVKRQGRGFRTNPSSTTSSRRTSLAGGVSRPSPGTAASSSRRASLQPPETFVIAVTDHDLMSDDEEAEERRQSEEPQGDTPAVVEPSTHPGDDHVRPPGSKRDSSSFLGLGVTAAKGLDEAPRRAPVQSMIDDEELEELLREDAEAERKWQEEEKARRASRSPSASNGDSTRRKSAFVWDWQGTSDKQRISFKSAAAAVMASVPFRKRKGAGGRRSSVARRSRRGSQEPSRDPSDMGDEEDGGDLEWGTINDDVDVNAVIQELMNSSKFSPTGELDGDAAAAALAEAVVTILAPGEEEGPDSAQSSKPRKRSAKSSKNASRQGSVAAAPASRRQTTIAQEPKFTPKAPSRRGTGHGEPSAGGGAPSYAQPVSRSKRHSSKVTVLADDPEVGRADESKPEWHRRVSNAIRKQVESLLDRPEGGSEGDSANDESLLISDPNVLREALELAEKDPASIADPNSALHKLARSLLEESGLPPGVDDGTGDEMDLDEEDQEDAGDASRKSSAAGPLAERSARSSPRASVRSVHPRRESHRDGPASDTADDLTEEKAKKLAAKRRSTARHSLASSRRQSTKKGGHEVPDDFNVNPQAFLAASDAIMEAIQTEVSALQERRRKSSRRATRTSQGTDRSGRESLRESGSDRDEEDEEQPTVGEVKRQSVGHPSEQLLHYRQRVDATRAPNQDAIDAEHRAAAAITEQLALLQRALNALMKHYADETQRIRGTGGSPQSTAAMQQTLRLAWLFERHRHVNIARLIRLTSAKTKNGWAPNFAIPWEEDFLYVDENGIPLPPTSARTAGGRSAGTLRPSARVGSLMLGAPVDKPPSLHIGTTPTPPPTVKPRGGIDPRKRLQSLRTRRIPGWDGQ